MAVCLATAGLLSIAGRALAQPAYSQADKEKLASYALSVDHVNKAAQAQADIRKIVAADPSIAQSIKASASLGLDQQFARVKSTPSMVGAIGKAGLSVEDYGMTMACALGAHMAQGASARKGPPGAAEAWMRKLLGWQPSNEQIAFAATHSAEMHGLMKAIGMER
jgi:hypothetical protein